jgi:hypothetical protein
MTLQNGSVLNNRYRIVEILGRGGMGSVYRAVDENLGVEVALKENLFTTEEYERQFRNEAVILATLRHPNLTRVTDHFVIENQGQYLVMDYIEGEDLRQRMDRAGVISEEEAVLIGAAICDALSYLHTHTPPVIHRDIKPGNVKITPKGEIYLVDFGLAKFIRSGQATTTGARAMTPGYSPPEQYGTAPTDERSDIFSLGATLYAGLTGTVPEDALARAMGQIQLTPVRKHNPKISKRMASVIEKSMAIKPDDRCQSAEDFKQALFSVRAVNGARASGNYIIEPPPPSAVGSTYPPMAAVASGSSGEYVVGAGGVTAYNGLGNSAAGAASPASTSGAGRRTGCVYILLVGILLVAAGFVAYLFYPSWPVQAQRALGLIVPIGSNALPVALTDPSATPTVDNSPLPMPTLADTATATATQTLEPTPTQTLPPLATIALTPTIPEPTPTNTPGPRGGGSGEIAYASDDTENGETQIMLLDVEVYLKSEGKEKARQITNIPGGACQPAWSPDGQWLVFTVPCDTNQALYRGSGLWRIKADDDLDNPTTLEQLSSDILGGDFDPAWSPDGSKIIFTSLRDGGRARIYSLDLTSKVNPEDSYLVERLSLRTSYDLQPAWSTDGQKIAFVSTQKGPVQVWTMDSDGSNQTMFSRSGNRINSHPQWSINGERILLTQVEELGQIPKLVVASYIKETEDSDDQGIYDEVPYDLRYDLGLMPAREAKYSPNGGYLAFESWPEGQNHDIYIMAVSGGDLNRLTTWERFDFDAAWRPAVARQE